MQPVDLINELWTAVPYGGPRSDQLDTAVAGPGPLVFIGPTQHATTLHTWNEWKEGGYSFDNNGAFVWDSRKGAQVTFLKAFAEPF